MEYHKRAADEFLGLHGVNRSEKVASAILQSYARNILTLTAKNIVFKDVNEHPEGVSTTSFDVYLDALQRLFVIQDVKAWSPAIRSASAIRRGSKRELTLRLTRPLLLP